MVTNDLGACEWFVWDLRRSGLIERGQLDQLVGEFLKRNPRAEAPVLAEYLVSQGSLSEFQADRILNGKTQGLVLGPYVLQDAIGQGSMGQVYKATSKNDNTIYAVKVLPRRSMWNVRLARRQVRSFGQFTHPAVVPFVDVGTAGGLHYLVWPLADGQTLEAMIQQHGKLSVAQTALLGVQVSQGLAISHQNNLFHGLLKPSNIMVGRDSQSRILDFGIGSLLVENEGESLVDTMSTANTLTSGLDCAAPESILEPSNRTPAGDQYSLGCVLYYCLTGRPPYPEGSAVEKMMAHQSKEPEPIHEFNPDVPDSVVEVVRRLMAKKPEDRYGSLDEVVESLESFIGEFAGHEESSPMVAKSGGSRGRMNGIGSPSNLGASSSFPSRVSTPIQTPPPVKSSFPSSPAPQSRAGTSGPTVPPSRAGNPGGFPPPPPIGPTAPPSPVRSSMAGVNTGIRGSMTGLPAPSSLPSRPNPAARASMPGFPPSQPVPVRSNQPYPVRGSFSGGNNGYDPGEVPLTMAEPPPFADPNRQSMPGGWVPPDEDDRKAPFGTLGLILAALLLASLVFLGTTLMMK